MNSNSDPIKDLEFIKRTMEQSTTYTNIPAMAYFSSGILAMGGCLATYLRLGAEGLANMPRMDAPDVAFMAITWGLVFLLAVITTIVFSAASARVHRIPAWNALSSRVFLSQIPMVVAVGIITVSLALRGDYELIPALWLLGYGVMLFSISYFTGSEHRVQAIVYMLLGSVASFMTGQVNLLLMALGFGGVNLGFGLARFFKLIGNHGPS